MYVADRENHRIQIFDGNGKYQAQWHNVHRPNGLGFTECGCRRFYVGENGPALKVNHNWPNLGPRISILDGDGNLLTRLGSLGHAPGQFIAPHGIAADSRGDIYLGEVSLTGWPQHFQGPAPHRLKCLQKAREASRLSFWVAILNWSIKMVDRSYPRRYPGFLLLISSVDSIILE